MKKLLLLALVLALGALIWSFTPQKLAVPEGSGPVLPALAAPVALRVGVLETGAMQSNALFAYRGGGFEQRTFGMDVVVVEHPQGVLLFDAGFGRKVLEHERTIPWLMRATSKIVPAVPLVDQLASVGLTPDRLKGVVLTHAHWDHVGGLDDLRGVPVYVNAAERDFIEHGGDMTALVRSFGALNYQDYAFDGPAYAGFAASHDVFGDGSVVLVPAGGHTPGSAIAFIRAPDHDYALIGDLAWQHEGVDLPAEKPWVSRWLVDNDAAKVRDDLVALHRLQAANPRLTIVPAHDRRVSATLPRLPRAPLPTDVQGP
jgi:N-acyl homoserine lactone hydrolase